MTVKPSQDMTVRIAAVMIPLFPMVLGMMIFVEAQEETVEVTLKQGIISGVKEDAGHGRFFYKFQGIPYAQPPVGKLRLVDPVAAGGWEGIKNGSVMPPLCPQIDFASFVNGIQATSGEEDCLYLNVYTPGPHKSNLPVMVFIFGGGYFLGSAHEYPPLPLLTKDIVYVIFNYRLGALGFLSSEDPVMPGNLGLKDQIMALKWVQDNIHDLGGDPNKVTLFGENVGAIACHLHMISPHSGGLFQRVIMMSGTALIPRFMRNDHRHTAAKVGKKLGCLTADTADFDSATLLTCLQDEVSAVDLVYVAGDFVEWLYHPVVMLPRVDGDVIPSDPTQLLKEGKYRKMDVIIGGTQHEGSITTKPSLATPMHRYGFVENFTVAGPLSVGLDEGDDELNLFLARMIYYKYVGRGEIKFNEENAEELNDMFGDSNFRIPMKEAAMVHARDTDIGFNTYVYELQHRGEQAVGDNLPVDYKENWVGHGDIIQYVFSGGRTYDPLKRDDDLLLSDIFTTMITNFAKTGNPTPNGTLGFRWEPTSGPCLRYLSLTPTPTMKEDAQPQLNDFWRNLPTKQNKILYPERFTSDYIPPRANLHPCRLET